MNNNLFMIAVFWGVWIIIPVLFDGILTFIYMLTIVFHEKYHTIVKRDIASKLKLYPETLPKVSVIIPTYNEEENINECLDYLKIQNYPQEKMEIIVVDNGSTDETSNIVKKHMKEIWQLKQGNGNVVNGHTYEFGSFAGLLRLVVRYEKGKAKALNAGIRLAQGEIIINIDCRSFLAPDAIYNMVRKFVTQPEYGAVTGNVEIGWRLIYERGLQGNYLLDQNGHYKPRELSRKEKFLAKSQFMEYLTSFRLGRQFQDITGSMFTFSGAFSAFRREVILHSSMYQSRTVAEDTDLTLNLQGQNVRLGFATDAKAYLKPVLSFERFYAQRIRWHRGQIEVIGLHLGWYGNLRKGFWRNLWLSTLLMIDHTFGFPRIIWLFLLPLFFLFGYSTTLIIEAIFLMYAFYVLIDFLNAGYCYQVVDKEARKHIKNSIQYCFVTPFFRLLTFYFRFAGYLDTLKEPQAWTTPINPVRSVKGSYQKTINFGLKVWRFVSGQKSSPAVYYDEKIAELDNFGLENAKIQVSPQVSNGEIDFKQKKMDGVFNEQKIKERG
ncbi:MAG: hypothetical protein HW405_263 [Candidatus Berkelbacteria bacterium]|nr:hypothetical protein [Candidatus Berkelbacteria bacterium]